MQTQLFAFEASASTELLSQAVQDVPTPKCPDWQVQVNEPAMSAQSAVSAQVSAEVAHSSMSEQATPSPEKPVSQAHVKDPSLSVQAALLWQLSASVAHSSMSEQLVPAISQPTLQAQLKLPKVLSQYCSACEVQVSRPRSHSSKSAQVMPPPGQSSVTLARVRPVDGGARLVVPAARGIRADIQAVEAAVRVVALGGIRTVRAAVLALVGAFIRVGDDDVPSKAADGVEV